MEEATEMRPMAVFPSLAFGDVGTSVGWASEVLGIGSVPSSDGGAVGLADGPETTRKPRGQR